MSFVPRFLRGTPWLFSTGLSWSKPAARQPWESVIVFYLQNAVGLDAETGRRAPARAAT
jgi:hypothetical protein